MSIVILLLFNLVKYKGYPLVFSWQAECEELQHRVESLSGENRGLRDELQRLSEECEKLTSENNSIKACSLFFFLFSHGRVMLQQQYTYRCNVECDDYKTRVFCSISMYILMVMQEELTKLLGPDAVSKLENGKSNTHEGGGDEGNCQKEASIQGEKLTSCVEFSFQLKKVMLLCFTNPYYYT